MTKELEKDRIDVIKEYLRSKLAMEPKNIGIYQEALTHSTCGYPNNQRLAFLGDRIYELVVVQHLLEANPDLEKGRLTSETLKIHDEPFQAKIARDIGLVEPMAFGETYRNTEKSELAKKDGIMEEALEALFAAIYLDQGLDKVREVADAILF
jgi:ribonuclease-3